MQFQSKFYRYCCESGSPSLDARSLEITHTAVSLFKNLGQGFKKQNLKFLRVKSVLRSRVRTKKHWNSRRVFIITMY